MSLKPQPKPKTLRWLDIAGSFPVGGNLKRPKTAIYTDKTGVLESKIQLVNANSQKGTPGGTYDRVCVHWQVTNGRTYYDDYHVVQGMDTDGEPVMVRCVPRGRKGQHLHMRNTGCFGFSFAAMGPADIGAIRLEMMAKAIAEFCYLHKLDPRGKTKDGFWVVDDHAAYAAVDYPGQRWDVGSQLPNQPNGKPDPRNIMAPLRKKVWVYYDRIVADPKHECEFAAILYA